ncbi:pyruvate carboxylase [Methylopila capsulata]|uniref:Pyruvate carboxylase n=1 Tax=Methylopila capsulata TaxID=61654 RepID=A0A9W6MT43_9HYPH|nr:pyruvate carboxylase [Methylopila capsulata]MBM7852502.1 pyruvate carboxylase [Methylopila capsulata]GLK56711.1 pyruvate carboxylase [Methylopila capsulata]
MNAPAPVVPPRKIRKLLVANRSEIAIRVFRAAAELGIRTVAIYAEEDKLSLHRFKSDEAYQVGHGMGPLEAYLSIPEVIRVATEAGVDAIHPGYGFLSESPEFAEACAEAKILFIGPSPDTMRSLGNKVAARNLAESVGVPVMPATAPLPDDPDAIRKAAEEIGLPVMLKASWGGGGRGMRVIRDMAKLIGEVTNAKREAKAAFGKDEVYLEKLVERARHVEVQVLGDRHGNTVHLFERDCSVQRRNQKVVERAPAPYLDAETRAALCESGLKIARATDYLGAGTIEFLMNADTGEFYFIEVNPRIQVEHTVTEVVTGVDIVKAQIKVIEGETIGTPESGVPLQGDIRLNGHALQCRITTENPEDNFIPDYGRITAYRGAMGFGIRVDGGTAYSGAVITRFYDPMLEKVTAWAPTAEEACLRMQRAISEYRIRGVATNLAFLENVVRHPTFLAGETITRFIDETPALFAFEKRQDRATKLLTYVADVTVNGHPEAKGRAKPKPGAQVPTPPVFGGGGQPSSGSRQLLEKLGPKKFGEWMRAENRVLFTDTTMRDAHQSLLATRVRTFDIAASASSYAQGLPELLSLECWGGATFDVAMRFLTEDPWERLAKIREAAPNLLLQCLVRGSNGVGYANYPDNAVAYFIGQAANGGVDLFRVFDCLNWIDNMRVTMDAVNEAGKICEAAICYTGDVLDPSRAKYDLKYYVDLAKQLEAAGAHVLCLKDMAGLLKPAAARLLVKTLREETGLPLHLHTHDTSGIAGATLLAAIDAGVDAVDAAMDAFSGMTSQPCLGSVVAALKGSERDSGLDLDAIRAISLYWEAARAQYAAFENDLLAPASEVYLHEMPGGQFTNLKEQARSMGLESRWTEVARIYRDVNDMFGDIIKVTPTSKVVGDMALTMVSAGLTRAEVEDPAVDVSFPESVVQLMKGELSQPPGGFPKGIQQKVLKGEEPIEGRAGALMPPTDLDAAKVEVETKIEREVSSFELASYLMYPKVFVDYALAEKKYGPVSALPTPVYFYGLAAGDELAVEIERGKTLMIRNLGVGETDEEGQVKVFFELNGQPRIIKVPNRFAANVREARRKAEDGNPAQVAAPMPGIISTVSVKTGQQIAQGDVLLSIEAMKMETSIHADRGGIVKEVLVTPGSPVDAKDLLVVIEE